MHPLKRLEFVKGLIEDIQGDNLRLITGGAHEAGGGNGVDLPGNAQAENSWIKSLTLVKDFRLQRPLCFQVLHKTSVL